MHSYPAWKVWLVVIVLLVGTVLALPNVFGEAPALQLSRNDRTAVSDVQRQQVVTALQSKGLSVENSYLEGDRLVLRFDDVGTRLKARDAMQQGMGSEYLVALSDVPRTPGWMRAMGLKPMSLGLDLRGGVYFMYEVDAQGAVKQLLTSMESDYRTMLRKERIPFTGVASDGVDAVRVTLRSGDDAQKFASLVRKQDPNLSVDVDTLGEGGSVTVRLSPTQIKQRQDFAIQQNITTLRNRVDELGVTEPIVARQGLDRIVVQLPGVSDPNEALRVLGATATLEFRLVDEQNDALLAESTKRAPLGSKLYHTRDGRPVLLKRETIVSGEQLTDASSGFQQGEPAVMVTLDARGASKMLETTRQNLGKPMAVVFIEKKRVAENQPCKGTRAGNECTEEEVINQATIRGVFGSNFQITGVMANEARELALLLRAGSLAAPLYIVEQRTVGPSLGADNIERGVNALIIGLVLTFIFMAVYYQAFGLVANIVLLTNVVLLAALLSMLQASLSLPGIAGIVLTVGMAVDANILIFERIREELRNGVSPHAAIGAGYEKAFSAIADSNVTTLIAGVVLFTFGTGPVRGFAVVLSLGIVTSMFTALVVSRVLVHLFWGRKRKLDRLSIGMGYSIMEFFHKKTSYPFMATRKRWYVVSAALILGSLLALGFRGINFGIDFTGGVVLEMSFPQAADLEKVRDSLEQAGFGDAVVQGFGTPRDVLVRMLPEAGTDNNVLGRKVLTAIQSQHPGVELRRTEVVGGQVGAELAEKGALAVLFTFFFIMLYVWARFQWKLGVGAIVAALHDPVIILGFFAATQMTFDLPALAAILAVIGYSLNDTVVVFDRIRERFVSMRKGTSEQVIDASINETLSRTIMTSATTMLTVFALLFFGGEILRGFSTALTIGIVVGTYSSIYIASALALDFKLTARDLLPVQKEKDAVDDMP